MAKCKECRFWASHADWVKPDGMGTCRNLEPLWEAYQSQLDTCPDFGCIQFQPNDDFPPKTAVSG